MNIEDNWDDIPQETEAVRQNIHKPPRVVQAFADDAVKVSHDNEIPAKISFFTILGQIVKDHITIPNGFNREDTRIHFCWIQTSGTGKSTLWNFVGPIANKTFEKINARKGKKAHPALETGDSEVGENGILEREFNVFGITDYTDSVLIGNWGEQKEMEQDPETWVETWTGNYIPKRNAGVLEGNGLAHWDEFEYSGVFKQTQYNDKSIVYLNTLMNSLAGESWVISKALASYDNKIMKCYSERSVLAMTYPPSNLNEVIAQKGVLQRMLLYVKNVPKSEQHRMRLEQLGKAGTIEEKDAPVDRYANALYKIYETVIERYEEVGGNPEVVMRFDPSFGSTLRICYEGMNKDIWNTNPAVSDIASNFTTRLMVILIKMAVLCSVAEAPMIKDKSKRFVVTPTNVYQARLIIQDCYSSLVGWLEQTIKPTKKSITEEKLTKTFVSSYRTLKKDSEGYVHKTILLNHVIKESGKSKPTVYRQISEEEHKLFDTKKIGRSTYLKLKGDINEV